MKLKIKRATENDFNILMKIWEESKYFPQTKNKMLKTLKKSIQHSEIYLASSNKPVAYFVITHKLKITYLNWISVINSQKGKGIGYEILKKVEKRAKENKSNKIQLGVFSKNFKAIGLYTKHKYIFKGFKDSTDKKLGRKILMEKVLR